MSRHDKYWNFEFFKALNARYVKKKKSKSKTRHSSRYLKKLCAVFVYAVMAVMGAYKRVDRNIAGGEVETYCNRISKMHSDGKSNS